MTTYTAAANTTRAFCSSFSSSSRKRSIVLGRSDEKNFHRNHHPYGNKRERITRRASSSASLSSKNSEKSERKRRRRESFRGFTTTAFATKEGKFLSSSERDDATATSHRERDDVLGVFNKKNVGKPPFNVALMVMVAATAFGAFVVGGQDVAWAEMGDVAAAVAEEDLESTGGGFAQAFLLILLSELGDKTFFYLALARVEREEIERVFRDVWRVSGDDGVIRVHWAVFSRRGRVVGFERIRHSVRRYLGGAFVVVFWDQHD